MPNVKPISDLKNYNDVLRDVSRDKPVFLTRNGKTRYVVVEINEYEQTHAERKLMAELVRGECSGQETGWLALDSVESEFLG